MGSGGFGVGSGGFGVGSCGFAWVRGWFGWVRGGFGVSSGGFVSGGYRKLFLADPGRNCKEGYPLSRVQQNFLAKEL